MIGTGLAIPEIATRRRGGGGAAPPAPPARFASFPALAAAWAAGRALVSIVGDSTTFGLGAGQGGFYGSSGGANAVNPAHFLRAGLAAAGVTAIDGCIVTGGRNAFTSGPSNIHEAEHYYDDGVLSFGVPAWDFGAGAGWNDPTPWGVFLGTNGAGGSAPTGFTPGFAWDRGEVFLSCDPGNYTQAGIFAGGAQIGFTGWIGNGALTRFAVDKPLGADRLDVQRLNGGMTGLGAIRVWDSGRQHVQIETLGNPDWRTSNWAATGQGYSPLTALPMLGAHLAIVNLGLNDHNYGRTLADFRADLTTIAAALQASGADVLLAVPTTTSTPDSTYHLPDDWAAAIFAVAADLGLPAPIDLRGIGLVAGDYFDPVHLVASGYRKVGEAYAARLLG